MMKPAVELEVGLRLRRVRVMTVLFSLTVLAFWQFPTIWYTHSDGDLGAFWLTGKSQLEGWNFKEIPVSDAEEKALVADRLVNGEFKRGEGETVRVFSAKRYSESPNEIGLFAHTPDRCWVGAGWRIELAKPDFKKITIHGLPMVFERRIFSMGNSRELVYFGGLVGGQPLPYRLDHNLSVGLKQAMSGSWDRSGSFLRALDGRFWRHVRDSFLAGRRLMGPKQFIRISVPLLYGNDEADALMAEFLSDWLHPVDYGSELRSWKQSRMK